MSDAHERLHELSGLYSAGALTEAEASAFLAHLADCEVCRAEVAAFRAVAAGLARAVPQIDPPARLRERIMRTVAGRTGESGDATASRGPRRTVPVLPWLFAAASVALALALGGYSMQLGRRLDAVEGQLRQAGQQLSAASEQLADARLAAVAAQSQVAVLAAPDLVRFDLAGQPTAPAATARAFWSRSRGMVFTATNLPSPPAGRVYQLWVLTAAGTPVSVGLLEPVQAGALTSVFETPADIPQPAQLAVSDEPPGGVPAPTGAIWVAGKPAA